jgi:hypothetical protein
MNHLEVRMARDLAALRAQVSAQAAKVEQAGLLGRVSAALASTPLVGALAPGSWRGGRS